MEYKKGKKQLTIKQLKREHSNVSFPVDGPTPEWLEEKGYTAVEPVVEPEPERPIELDEPETYYEKRRQEYPALTDQFDVIWKQFNHMRMEGQPLIQEADDMLGEILAVKKKYPKT
jgi:hypothetical protein